MELPPETPAPRLRGRTFADAVAVVTGAAVGIGAQTARSLAARGARVVLVDVDLAAAERQAATINAEGGWAKAHRLDVADRAAVERAAAELVESLGAIDIAVNNAGVTLSAHAADMEPGDWERIRSVNLDGVIHGCAAFGAPMLEAGAGHVVNVASGLPARRGAAADVATKAAVLAWSRSLRAEWAAHGVGVSVVRPGATRTTIFDAAVKRGPLADAVAENTGALLHRRGQAPVKVAEAICRAIEGDVAELRVGWDARLGRFPRRR